jgi:hypothetical protein
VEGGPLITLSAFDLAQTAITSKNSNPGARGGARGGGRRNPDNLFGVLLHDITIPTSSGQNNTMYYRVEKRNQPKKDGTEKGKRPPHYTTTYTASRLKANRIQYREFKEAFLPFLVKLDWPAIYQKSETEVTKKAGKERDKLAAELHHVTTVIEQLEPLKTKTKITEITLTRLQDAEHQKKKLEAQIKVLDSEIDMVRAKDNALLDVKEFIRLINEESAGTVDVRLKLQAEIERRVQRVDLDFRIDPKIGKIITAEVVFVNDVTRTITIYSDQHFALLFEEEKGKNRKTKAQLTPEVHPKRKMTDDTAVEIHRLYREEGMSQSTISRLKGLGVSTVRRITRGARYVHVFKKLYPNETPMLEKSQSKYANGERLIGV